MPHTQPLPTRAPADQVPPPAADRFFDLALDLLCIVGPDGDVLRVNPAFEAALGWTAAMLRGRRLRDLVHPDDVPDVWAQIDRIRTGTTGGALRGRYRHADGSYRHVSWRLSPPDDEGHVWTAGRDITEAETARGHVVATLERVTDALISLDRDWRITYANPTALAMGRLTRDGAVGHVFWDVVPGLVGTRFEAEYRRAMTGRVRTGIEDYFPPLDIWVRVDAYPSEDGLTLYLRDVSKAREAREQLRLHAAILESMGQAVVATDPMGRIRVWNAAAERQYGWTAAEVLGRNVAEVTAAPDSLAQSRRLAMEVAAGGSWSGELVNRRKDGAEIELALTLAPVRDEAGRLSAMVGVSTDITERNRVERELRESRRVLATLFANLPGLAYRCRYEAEFAIELASDGALALTGYTAAELVRDGFDFATLIHPDDREPVWREVQRAVEHQEPFRLNYRLRRRDGVERWVWEQGRAVYDADGQPIALEGFISDVTERRTAEEQLRQAQKMEAVGQLAGGVAHDFNNLLTVIQAYTEFLAEQLDESNPLHGDVVAIQRAASRAASLTRQLLAFSRKQVLQPRVLDLNGVVGGLEPMLHRLIGEDIRVAMRTAPALGKVKADPGQLEQVLLNLAVNARDAMPRGGTLSLETADVMLDATAAAEHGVVPGAYVRLVVRDTGCGMDEATRSRVFEPFFTTKEVGRGTGLGLSTVYGIVKQSEGFVTCESAPGAGTTFAVHLPRVDVVVGAAEPARAAATPPGGTETVLLVEDEPAVRSLGRRILERQGYQVLEARDGADARRVAAAHAGPIHLLVTDIVMPELGGSQLYEALRAAGRGELRVLYVSGYAGDELARRDGPAAGGAFLQKPFSPAALAASARAVLDAPR